MRINDDERSPYFLLRVPVKSVNVVHYKPAADRLEQMEQHETVRKRDDERLDRNWYVEETIAEKYEQNQPEFLHLLEESEDIWMSTSGR